MTLLTFTANDPDRATITVVNEGALTGFAISEDGPDWGSANYSSVYAGQRGTQGARPGFGVADNRTVTIPLRVYGEDSKDLMTTRVSALVAVVDKMRRFGGTILWKSSGSTYRAYFQVLASGSSLKQWNNAAESNNIIELISTFNCSPYVLGDPMDTFDGFDTDTLSTDWTVDVGTAGTIVTGGVLKPQVTSSYWVARHTAKGYHPRDVQVTVKVTPGATMTAALFGVSARMSYDGTQTGVFATVTPGTNKLDIYKMVNNAPTSVANGSFTPVASTPFWLRIRAEGNVLFAEAFNSAPTPTSTPATAISYAMTTAEAARFYLGDAGLWTSSSTAATETYDDFTVEPMTYRLVNTPEVLVLSDYILGDAPAIADIVISPLGGPASALAGSAPIWGKASWHERPPIYNFCWDGDFEDVAVMPSGAAATQGGWTTAAVTNVIGAATSINRDTTAANIKYGSATAKVICPATSGTGAAFPVYRRAKKGRLYALVMWVSGSAATNTSLMLGFNDGADITVESAAALSTSAPKLRMVTWRPTADRDFFYAGIKITAATATNLFLDGVNILEVPSIALELAVVSAGQANLNPYSNSVELPATPFNIVIENEMMTVTDTGSWAVIRGVEGTTAATHAADSPIVILPKSRRQYEGRGAVPPVGIIEGESYVTSLSSATTNALVVTADTAARGGNKVRWNAVNGLATYEWFIDPALVIPDDYATGYNGGEVDIEVWARIEMINTLTSPSALLSAIPEGGTTKGAERYTREYNQATKPLTVPSVQNYRYTHLGTIPMYVDRANPLRWILKLILAQTAAAGAQFNVDYLYLNVSRWRVCSITGKSYNANFPQFIPYDAAWSNTSSMTKTLKSDGTAFINEAGKPSYPDSGLGRTIELPTGPLNGMVKLSNRIPDDTTAAVDKGEMDDDAGTPFAGTLGGSYAATVHFAVTPRFLVVRGGV